MSRSNFPQSDVDRVAAATTAVAIAAVVWVIVAFAPEAHGVSFSSAQAAPARHVDEGNRAGAAAAKF
ncbi:MAG TPA: hypothetical protein VGL25_05950 [Casimicrobiaceae bacterium]|jgi:hypothetical protein